MSRSTNTKLNRTYAVSKDKVVFRRTEIWEPQPPKVKKCEVCGESMNVPVGTVQRFHVWCRGKRKMK